MDEVSLMRLLEDLRDEFLREVIRSVRKQSSYESIIALGGLDAVERVARRVKLSSGQPFEFKRPICRMG